MAASHSQAGANGPSKLETKMAGWLGALCLCVAPYTIDTHQGKLCAIAGLTLLTIQAIDSKLWNLVVLNVVGIGGYTYALHL